MLAEIRLLAHNRSQRLKAAVENPRNVPSLHINSAHAIDMIYEMLREGLGTSLHRCDFSEALRERMAGMPNYGCVDNNCMCTTIICVYSCSS